MKKNNIHPKHVRQYFDRIAENYPKRLNRKNSFHAQFFDERLHKATEGLLFQDKKIWDIGAGTGVLYDYIVQQTDRFDYYACDLSAKMLAESQIPPERRHTGPPNWLQFPDSSFDYIFLLGVSSYLSSTALKEWIPLFAQKLRLDGRLVISFTNRNSWDYQLRKQIRPVVRLFVNSRQLIAQPFQTQAYDYLETLELFSSAFQLQKMNWLHNNIPLLNRVWPALSAKIARKLNRKGNRTQQLSADFLLTFSKS